MEGDRIVMKYRVGALVTGTIYDKFEADSEERTGNRNDV